MKMSVKGKLGLNSFGTQQRKTAEAADQTEEGVRRQDGDFQR